MSFLLHAQRERDPLGITKVFCHSAILLAPLLCFLVCLFVRLISDHLHMLGTNICVYYLECPSDRACEVASTGAYDIQVCDYMTDYTYVKF
jgi:hypothetical protein